MRNVENEHFLRFDFMQILYFCSMISKGILHLGNGETVEAMEPVIVSASRATDIPAFFTESFFQSLEKGYLIWTNPFNAVKHYVSFKNTRLIVFWSKNPKPLLPYFDSLNRRHIHSYLHFTLNDYEAEGWEPNVPPLHERINTFKACVQQWGKGKVIWRFDPLMLSDAVDVDTLLQKVKRVGDELQGFTEKLVFSFADINAYRKVQRNLKQKSIRYRNFTDYEMFLFAEGLQKLNKSWHYSLASCAESIDLEPYGIEHARCIDDALLLRFFADDTALMKAIYAEKNTLGEWELNRNNKDKGQREACRCITSKDIGAYRTCRHACVYCYAGK